jgi:hypothetical protein
MTWLDEGIILIVVYTVFNSELISFEWSCDGILMYSDSFSETPDIKNTTENAENVYPPCYELSYPTVGFSF